MSGRYAYSLDRETFLGRYETRADALRAAITAARQQPEPPREVYVAIRVAGDTQAAGHAEHVIHRMCDRARAASESAARYLQNISEQEEAELDDMLARTITGWLTKHDRLPTFYSVEAISEHPVPNPPRNSTGQQHDEVTEIGTGELGTAEFPFGR
jgi:Arc/MetJ-type ribon-helix-helix transcriptional regulator